MPAPQKTPFGFGASSPSLPVDPLADDQATPLWLRVSSPSQGAPPSQAPPPAANPQPAAPPRAGGLLQLPATPDPAPMRLALMQSTLGSAAGPKQQQPLPSGFGGATQGETPSWQQLAPPGGWGKVGTEFLDSFPSPIPRQQPQQSPQQPAKQPQLLQPSQRAQQTQQDLKTWQAQQTQQAQQAGRIGEIPGYPETGKLSWRASNDAVFIKAATDYNARNNFSPGDPLYLTPRQLKAQAMEESGGDSFEKVFRTDPLQMNNPGDWADDKQKYAGITKGQKMTPETSADAATKWLLRKAQVHNTQGKIDHYKDMYGALRAYNGKASTAYERTKGKPLMDYYATKILQGSSRP